MIQKIVTDIGDCIGNQCIRGFEKYHPTITFSVEDEWDPAYSLYFFVIKKSVQFFISRVVNSNK